MSQINRVVLTGNLTTDPELRATGSGTSVCSLRIASTARRKDAASDEWVDYPNYFNVTVWGGQGESAARHLCKGRAVAIDGHLQWREWESVDGGKRQGLDVIAENVQFLGAPNGNAEVEPVPEPQEAGAD